MNAHEARFVLDDLTKTKTIREIMQDAMVIAVTHAAGRVMHCYHPEIVDEHDIGRYHHFHLMIAGEHTDSDHRWQGKVVKGDFMTVTRMNEFHDKLKEKLAERDLKVCSISLVFFHDQRKFGFSVIVDKSA